MIIFLTKFKNWKKTFKMRKLILNILISILKLKVILQIKFVNPCIKNKTAILKYLKDMIHLKIKLKKHKVYRE